MTTHIEQLRALQVHLATTKPDLLVALGRALLWAFLVFTFVSGLVFTVWPLTVNVFHYLVALNESLVRWVWEEPTYGLAMLGCIQLAGLTIVLYLLRKWVLLFVLYVADRSVALWQETQSRLRKTPARRPPVAANTDIVAG